MNKTIAVILAGGKGERFADNLPKQFVKLAGKSVIEYTLNAFNRHKYIDEIYVVVKDGFEENIWTLVKKNRFQKVVKVITGGEDRFWSTNIAINAMRDEDSNTKVLFHDGVRPLIDEVTIYDVVKALDRYDAVVGIFESPPFREGSLDAVYTAYAVRDAINHLEAIRNLSKVMKDGGLFIDVDIGNPDNRIVTAILRI